LNSTNSLSKVTALKQQLNTEQEANAELRRIIAGLVQRVPELEPAQERPEAPEPPPESRPATGDAQEGIERVSWWRRVTGWRRSP
jgi:hypothetical protein